VEGWFSRNRLVAGIRLTVVGRFVLDWWDMSDAGMEPGVVEPPNPVQSREFEIVDSSPGPFVADAFGFVESDC